jgi:hypothetical protein
MATQSDKHLDPDSSKPSNREHLLLTDLGAAPEPEIPQLQPGGPAVKLDDLGPLVVNSDGVRQLVGVLSTMLTVI